MNAKRIAAAEGVILAALKTRQLAVGIAIALESACLLQSPETAAELAAYRALELGTAEGRISAKCEDASHPVWLRDLDDIRGCPWCQVAVLEAERHSTNEALSDAAEALRVQRDRIAELESLTPAPIQTCRACGAGYKLGQPCSTCEFQTLMAAEQAKRQQEDPHDSPLHHDYAVGRDLPEVGRA